MKAKNPHAVALGSIKTEKKAAAARVNAQKGGRPLGPHRRYCEMCDAWRPSREYDCRACGAKTVRAARR